jgi:hypothetical protein
MHKLFADQRALLVHSLTSCSYVSLTSNIWFGNAKEDYISVVAHHVGAD